MRKILLACILFFGVYGSTNAMLSLSTYEVDDITLTLSNWAGGDGNDVLMEGYIGATNIWNLVAFNGVDDTIGLYIQPNSEARMVYILSSGNAFYRNYGSETNVGVYNKFGIANTGTYAGYYVFCSTVTTTCFGLLETDGSLFSYTYGLETTILGDISDNILRGTYSFSTGICTLEDIPDYSFIDIQPTSTGAISELISDPDNNTYGYSTSLSGDNPLQIIMLGMVGVDGFPEFSTQSGSLSFLTESSTFFSSRTTWLTINSTAISYIKLLGNYGEVDIYIYNSDGQSIKRIDKSIDLASYTEGYGYPVGETPRVAILFNNSRFGKEIESLGVYAIGANQTKEVEICYNEDTGDYTVDGELYTGNPYTDLVGTPTPTDFTFSENGYLFYDNGFCLKNFIPSPSGGQLLFDIKDPTGELKTTYPIVSSGLYKYGDNTCSKITTNYHEVAGQYYVKGRYFYNGVSYDLQDNFTAYTISSPESIPGIDEVNPWASQDICGADSEQAGFLPGVSRFFACMSDTISNFFSNQYQAIKQVGGFIYNMSEIFTTEVEDFSFFPKAYASEPISSVMNFSKPTGYDDTIFNKIDNLLWGAIAIIITVVSIGVFIVIKND